MQKSWGYGGSEVWIDLSAERFEKKPLREDVRKYCGGAGYAARILYDTWHPGSDPLEEKNLLVFATGPLTDPRVPGGGSLEICFVSPLTGLWGESRLGGEAGFSLRKAGIDILVITGKAPGPTALVIEDGEIRFLPCPELSGELCSRKEARLQEKLGTKRFDILSIGPGGENQVLYSTVMHKHRAAGRCGGGAVMGSKNLLALAVRGTKKVPLADEKAFLEACREAHKAVIASPGTEEFRKWGTMGGYVYSDASGDLPTKNWRSNSWGKGQQIFDHYYENNFQHSHGCYRGCTVQCGRILQVPQGPWRTPSHEGGEYESMAAFTAFCMNEDVDAAVHASWLCNEYGLDTISAGACLAFLFDCAEKKLLSSEEEPAWGKAEIFPEMLRKIAFREGLGDFLARGVRRMAEELGEEAREMAVHGKGLEGPAHDPRSGKSLGLSYATGNRGMCHIHPVEAKAWDADKQDFGLLPWGLRNPEEVDPWEESLKGKDVKLLQDAGTLPELFCTCKFYQYVGVTLDHYAAMLRGSTGWEISPEELLEMGERAVNLQRLFNFRQGMTPEADSLPSRVLSLPEFGRYAEEPRCIIRDLPGMLREYYVARGWHEKEGKPLESTLARLGL
ncbi:MAG TPA: aldehyde ferredoxin oxidoreductase family protein [Synergistaceae bacterium]|nr:aldehyde ferredoxin oxidoreductase family protein [Synergistaceae bacterium]HPQ37034.1 aldehyde ferredoxin oxidoreductase family protein [Synergistaceae bacterium]